MNCDLIKIKEKYGEKMMHLCRNIFSTILEEEGLLFNTLEANFAYSKFLYDDIVNNELIDSFKNYIYKLIEPQEKEEIIVTKTPTELLSEAGYDLYECKTESDIQSFIKYYAPGEALCTFNGGRLNRCYVFFAVKKNVEQIIRANFPYPQRQDEYGTSVISIQFTRGNTNTLSIKNRYNHRVANPDATFSNDLENIINGLTKSFEQEYNLNIRKSKAKGFEIPGYVKATDGKFYKYNYEINNIYYCTDNIIIDNFEVVDKYTEKEKYVITDYFIIDLVSKKISLYDERTKDSFVDGIQDIKKIEIVKDKRTKNKILKIIFEDESKKDAIIEIDKYNRLISYGNDNICIIEGSFLAQNEYLERLNLNNVSYIGNRFLVFNKCLQEINIPNVIEIGDGFLSYNKCLKEINIPFVRKIGSNFLSYNDLIEYIDFPVLSIIGDLFLTENRKITSANLHSLEEVGYGFLARNNALTKVDMPLVKKIGDAFLRENRILEEINIPSVISIGTAFLLFNRCLKKFIAENLVFIGGNFLNANEILEEIVIPNAEQVSDYFLSNNNSLKIIDSPKLKIIGNSFMRYNNSVVEVNLESLERIGNEFLLSNNCLKKINLPRLKKVGTYFLHVNKVLENLYLPELNQVGSHFLYNNEVLMELYAPNVRTVGKYFLFMNKMLENYDLSNLQEYGKCFCNTNRGVKTRILSRSN